MTEYIMLDSYDSWSARVDKTERFFTLPQPLYLLPGPGLYHEERVVLLSTEPWTPEAIRDTLNRVYAPQDAPDGDDDRFPTHEAWVQYWLEAALGCFPDTTLVALKDLR